jgi:hypothetical protein
MIGVRSGFLKTGLLNGLQKKLMAGGYRMGGMSFLPAQSGIDWLIFV